MDAATNRPNRGSALVLTEQRKVVPDIVGSRWVSTVANGCDADAGMAA